MGEGWRRLRRALMTPREVAYLVMTFVLTTLINSNYAIVAAFFQIHATTTLGLARDEVARIFAAFALSQLVVSPLSGPMASRFSRRRVLVCGVCGVSSATVLFGCASPVLLAAARCTAARAAAY